MKLLYRDINGLLYGKGIVGDFPIDFVLGDWSPPNNISLSLGSSSQGLRLIITNNSVNTYPGMVKNTQVSSRSKVFLYASFRQSSGYGRAGVIVYMGDNNPSSASDGVSLHIPLNYSSGAYLQEFIDAAPINIDYDMGPFSGGAGTVYQMWLMVDNGNIVSKDTLTGINWSGVVPSLTEGQIGIWSTAKDYSEDFYAFYAGTDRYVKVKGLISGDTIELRDSSSSVLDSAGESGGEALIDLFGQHTHECDRIVVKRSGNDYAQYITGADLRIIGGSEFTLEESVNSAPNAVSVNSNGYVKYNGNIYLTSISAHGELKASKFNISSGIVETTILEDLGVSNNDTHNCPNVMVDNNGYIWAFYTLHNVNNNIYYFKSSSPEDIYSFGSKQTISGFSGTTSYCYPFQRVDGRIIAFTRVNTGATNGTWTCAWSDNGGSSWSKHNFIGPSTWMYIFVKQCKLNKNAANALITWHVSNASIHDLRTIEIDFVTGNITVSGSGTVLGSIYTGSIFNPSNALQVFTATGTLYGWGEDINEYGEIFYIEVNNLDKDASNYKYVKVETGIVGSSIQVVETGIQAWSNVWGKGRFIKEGKVILSRESSGSWLIETYDNLSGTFDIESFNSVPDDDTIVKFLPLTSLLDESSFIIYSRVKGRSTGYGLAGDSIILLASVFVDFVGSPVSGTSPLTVNFTDLSSLTSTISSWMWEFGDGTPVSHDQNPTHDYVSHGVYSVTLTISDGFASGYISKSNYITVTESLIANFTGIPILGSAPLTVDFADISIGEPTSWDWDFGDEFPHSYAQNPYHTYNNGGVFSVTLVIGKDSTTDSITKTNYISVGIISDFVASPIPAYVNTPVQFYDQSLGNPDSWDWSFGDGTNHSTTQNPYHIYAHQGLYTITLTIIKGSFQSQITKEHYVEIILEDTGTGFVRDQGPTLIFD